MAAVEHPAFPFFEADRLKTVASPAPSQGTGRMVSGVATREVVTTDISVPPLSHLPQTATVSNAGAVYPSTAAAASQQTPVGFQQSIVLPPRAASYVLSQGGTPAGPNTTNYLRYYSGHQATTMTTGAAAMSTAASSTTTRYVAAQDGYDKTEGALRSYVTAARNGVGPPSHLMPPLATADANTSFGVGRPSHLGARTAPVAATYPPPPVSSAFFPQACGYSPTISGQRPREEQANALARGMTPPFNPSTLPTTIGEPRVRTLTKSRRVCCC